MINPGRIPRNPHPPPVVIERVLVDGRPSPPVDPIEVDAGRSRVELHYTGLSFIEPGQVRFRYRLEGFDSDWIDAGPNRAAYYTHLPPGRYQFRASAANNDGVWNETGASVALVVRPHFWQTRWFAALAAILLLVLAYAFYQRHIVRLRREHVLQAAFARRLIRSQEAERQRIAAGIHDGLGQNLLVIKNLAVLAKSGAGDGCRTDQALDEISTIASQSIHEARQIAHNLRPFQLDELGLTKALAGTARQIEMSTGISVATSVDELEGVFPPELEINVFRITQECLNNVVKHSGATEARLAVTRLSGDVRIVVEDNGHGFDPASITRNGDGCAGHGLRDIRERLKMMSGTLRIHSGATGGTRIEITVSTRERP